MKHVWIFIALTLTLTIPLFAQMAFTQRGTIPVTNGTFSYAELKSVQDTDRIVVYSQDTDNIYLTISDTDGNVVETMSLAMTDSTDTRKMSYFEYDETPYLVVNREYETQREYSGIDWTSETYMIGEIFNLDSAQCFDNQILGEHDNYLSHYANEVSSSHSSAQVLQPIVCYSNESCTVLIPFIYSNSNSWDGHGGEDHNNFSKSITYDLDLYSDDMAYTYTDEIGYYNITGNIVNCPLIHAGRKSSYSYSSEMPSGGVSKEIHADSLIIEAYQGALGGASIIRQYDRYALLSNNYPESPASFTMLSVDVELDNTINYTFSERDLQGQEIWSSTETSLAYLDYPDDCSAVSSCFTDDDDNPLTIYFAPDTTSYEIRNRLNGDVEDNGEAPFVPVNIERIGDETLVYLASTDDGVQVWHGTYTVGIDDPTDSPALDLVVTNFPNPFNPTTTIGYSIPTSGHVELNIYNTRGQRVKTLVNDLIDAGEHEITWNGDNDMGETVSSGVYLYRLMSSGKTVSGRMLMIK